MASSIYVQAPLAKTNPFASVSSGAETYGGDFINGHKGAGIPFSRTGVRLRLDATDFTLCKGVLKGDDGLADDV